MRARRSVERSRSTRRGRLAGLLAVLSVMALLARPDVLPAQSASTLSGRVSTAAGHAVADATVELRRGVATAYRTRTDSTGRYSFREVAQGTYVVIVRKAGLRQYSAAVRVMDGEPRTVDITMGAAMLNEVVVTAARGEQRLENVAAAVSVVGETDIQVARRAINLEESLRRVPGVRVEDELGTGERTRIIIRGTGTRANSPAGSGVRGVRVLVDGIPKNNAGGSAQDLINIDLSSVERMEVLRGPSSALYGNQSGGVVNLITEEGGPDESVSVQQTLGAYGLARTHAKVLGQTGAFRYRISGHRTDQDGFREHSRFYNTGLDSKFVFDVDERSRFTMLLAYERSFEESPGPLTAEQNATNREQASPVFVTNGVRATLDELRFGAIYTRELFGLDELQLTGYYIPRHLGPFVQIGVRIPQDFTNRGTNARYFTVRPLGGMESRLTVGVDFQNTPITTGTINSTTGVAAALLEEDATTFGAYAMEELAILPNVRLSAGARYDRIRFSSRDLVRPGSGAARTFTRTTPKVGITVQPIPMLTLYGTYGQGFETPVIGELRVIPGGEFGFNTLLDPQISTNYEAGARGDLFGRLAFELAAFHQTVDDLIIPVGTFPNNTFQNVGEVDQLGVELASRLRLFDGLSVAASYTFSDFTFDDFVANGVDLSGNELPGVPRHAAFGELSYQAANGLFGAVEAQWVGRFAFNNANDAFNPAYTVVNLRLAYDGVLRGTRIGPFLGVNNLLDEDYSAFALINDATRRFFNPLPGVNVYGGLRVGF